MPLHFLNFISPRFWSFLMVLTLCCILCPLYIHVAAFYFNFFKPNSLLLVLLQEQYLGSWVYYMLDLGFLTLVTVIHCRHNFWGLCFIIIISVPNFPSFNICLGYFIMWHSLILTTCFTDEDRNWDVMWNSFDHFVLLEKCI